MDFFYWLCTTAAMCFFGLLAALLQRLTRPGNVRKPDTLEPFISRPVTLELSILGTSVPLEPSISSRPVTLELSILSTSVALEPSISSRPVTLESSILSKSVALEPSISSRPVSHESSILIGQRSFESCILSKLNPEVTICIAQFLPIASAASFALCCRSIFGILGTRYWKALRVCDMQREREAFLSALERDLPDYILCYHCTILHSGTKTRYEGCIKASTRPVHKYGVRPCYRAELLAKVFRHIHENFNFHNFQMTMKRYRLGLDYSYNLSLLTFETTRRSYIEHFPYHCTVQARIVAGSLFLRIQEVILTPSDRALKAIANCYIAICRHIGNSAVDFEAQLPENVQCKVDHQHNINECIRRSELTQCTFCPTEYQIDLYESEGLGTVVVITKWLDLGEGRTITDSRWWSHLAPGYTEHHVFTENGFTYDSGLTNWRPVPFEVGSIFTSFEQDEHLPYDSVQTPERLNTLSKMMD